MMDDDRQARVLRERLDDELAAVRATAGARQRLARRTAGAGTGAGRRGLARAPRRVRSAIAVPLAAAFAAVAVVGGVAVPVYLWKGAATTQQPAGVPAPETSSPLPAPSATRHATAPASRRAGSSPAPRPARTGPPTATPVPTRTASILVRPTSVTNPPSTR